MILLKRKYADPNGPSKAVIGVEILNAKGPHNFSQRFLDGGAAEGWLSLGKGKIIIEGSNGSAIFKIVTTPGYFCCHCGEKLSGGSDGAVQRLHLIEKHSDKDGHAKPSPDPGNPSGWRLDLFYATELESAPKPTAKLEIEKQSSHKRPARYVPLRVVPLTAVSK